MANKYKLKIYPKASQDMIGIFDYIAINLCNKTAALNQANDFEKALNNVCLFPESCPIISNEYINEKNIRKLVVNNYIVFYKVNDLDNEIDVLRVLYGMMNYIDIL